MMVFFMRYCKKLSNFWGLSLFVLLLGTLSLAIAAESSIRIKGAELQPLNDFYSLSVDAEISFDKEIEEAVNKGVPIKFLTEFQIVRPRKYWFDDEIVTVYQDATLSYHALSRQYLVNRGVHQQSFESLSEAAQALVQIDEWKVLEKSALEKGETYNAALLIRLDKSKLPKAIQVDTIASEKWNLTSQKFEWTLKELNK